MSSQPIFVAVIGLGGVGKAFLSQYDQLRDRLAKQSPPIDLALILARRSKKQVLSERYGSLDVNDIPKMLEETRKLYLPFDAILDFLEKAPGKVVLVDNTSDQELAQNYPKVLGKGYIDCDAE